MKTWDVSFPDPRVRACFFGALNVSLTVPEHTENRRICMAHMGVKDIKINTPLQWHSSDCSYIDRTPESRIEGDALVTDKPNLPIGIVTADCAPLLFAGSKEDGSPIIGACHAGARGALKGVIQNTLTTMRTHGAVNITGWLGPCIHAPSYEVGQEFYEEFTATDPRTVACFHPIISSSSPTTPPPPVILGLDPRISEIPAFAGMTNGEGKHLFDLPLYVSLILGDENVPFQQIMVDTYTNEADCFSYRRATHRGEPDYGRQLSAIMISG